ncbi:hypothetical protein GQ54DRAFT_297945 [Martensiomyces pterosporus]|nr:hypothetical protein GQ54DRAFT_297945 [Martensiomyces pterosporus]
MCKQGVDMLCTCGIGNVEILAASTSLSGVSTAAVFFFFLGKVVYAETQEAVHTHLNRSVLSKSSCILDARYEHPHSMSGFLWKERAHSKPTSHLTCATETPAR